MEDSSQIASYLKHVHPSSLSLSLVGDSIYIILSFDFMHFVTTQSFRD